MPHEPARVVPVVARRVVRDRVGADTGVVVTGPLAPLFAQLHDTLESRHFVKGAYVCRYCWRSDGHDDDCPAPSSLAALSSIERHVQDMEKALAELLVVAQTDDPWLMGERYRELLSNARAALPAREKEEE